MDSQDGGEAVKVKGYALICSARDIRIWYADKKSEKKYKAEAEALVNEYYSSPGKILKVPEGVSVIRIPDRNNHPKVIRQWKTRRNLKRRRQGR